MAYTPHNKRDPEYTKKERRGNLAVRTAIVGVIVIAVAAGISAYTAIVMRRQITAMEAQQRPWLTAEPVAQTVEINGKTVP